MDGRAVVERVAARVVGRRREIELVVAALAADRHMLLEGPPGTGKSTLLRAVADELGIGFAFVEGNAELTPARLVGAFDPARVLTDGYAAGAFLDGPLVTALRDGCLLYVEEINRVPEETLNVLVTVMSEHELHVPRVGRIAASPGFRLVAAMNPFDAVGTARISSAVYDRTCRLAVGYQGADDELDVVTRVCGADPVTPQEWTTKVVAVVRCTREHADVRVGSSVRGAIDTVLVARQLTSLRGAGAAQVPGEVGLDAALVALSGRLRVREGVSRSAEDIVRELWRLEFATPDESARNGSGDGEDAGKVAAPAGATTTR